MQATSLAGEKDSARGLGHARDDFGHEGEDLARRYASAGMHRRPHPDLSAKSRPLAKQATTLATEEILLGPLVHGSDEFGQSHLLLDTNE